MRWGGIVDVSRTGLPVSLNLGMYLLNVKVENGGKTDGPLARYVSFVKNEYSGLSERLKAHIA